jgi:hypothetical protein
LNCCGEQDRYLQHRRDQKKDQSTEDGRRISGGRRDGGRNQRDQDLNEEKSAERGPE